MKKRYCISFIFIAGLLTSLFAQQIPGGAPGMTEIVENPTKIGGFQLPRITASADSFIYSTTTYTFGDLVVFSYFDGTVFNLIDEMGVITESVSLNRDEFHTFSAGEGISRIEGSNSFTLLTGDPVSASVMGYFAVDEGGRALSTRLNTYMPGWVWGGETFVVFAYEDDTQFVITDLTTQTVVGSGILNAGEHFQLDGVTNAFLSVTGSKPVSALSYADQGYYIPAANGTFAGQLFYGYSGRIETWTNGVIITAYYDNTNYDIIDSSTGDTLSTGTVNKGETGLLSVLVPTYYKVVSSQPVTVSNTPFAAWANSYFYLTRVIDESGSGIGTNFYAPAIPGDIDVFSYEDNNIISVYDMSLGQTVYTDTLSSGGGFRYSNSAKSVFHITGNENLSVLTSWGGSNGADFVPLSFADALPDLAISGGDIVFDPDSAVRNVGDPINIKATIYNYSTESAQNVSVQMFDGDPDGGIPISAPIYITEILGGSSATVEVDWTVPDFPEYHAIHVAVDREDAIIESNSSNNEAFRFIIANDDLLPPLSTTIDAPSTVEYIGGVFGDSAITVTANIFNNGTVEATNPTASLYLPHGLSLADSTDRLVVLPNIPGNGSTSHSWTVYIDELPGDTLAYFYSVTVGADSVEEKTLERMLLVNDGVAIEDTEPIAHVPSGIFLEQNYPNPFNPTTSISYTLAEGGKVDLMIFNMLGERVRTLVAEDQGIGTYNVNWDATSDTGESVASGTYVYRLRLGDAVMVRKMLLLR